MTGCGAGTKASTDEALTLDEFYERTRSSGFGIETKRRILLGTFALSRESYTTLFKKAQQVRQLVKQDFDAVWSGSNHVDVLVTPTTTNVAVPIAQVMAAESDPTNEYVNDVLTIPASLAGLPAASLPIDRSTATGLPLGIQVIGRSRNEAQLLRVCKQLEQLRAPSATAAATSTRLLEHLRSSFHS